MLRPSFMKFFFPTLCVVFLALFGLARAQDEGQLSAPPDEIITDFGIEEYLAVPKFTVTLGVRSIGGAKASFTGRGFVSSFQPTSDITTPNIVRIYHDANVLADNPIYTLTTTNTDGTTSVHIIAPTPAGFTNTWTFTDPKQIRDDGSLDFHSYAADVVDSGLHTRNPKTGMGVDLTFARDMGNLTKRLEWKLIFGASLTDIKSHTSDTLSATVTTITDNYGVNLNGQAALPTPPYTAPSFKQVPEYDANGLPVYDATGAQVLDYVETTIYLSNTPTGRTTTVTAGTVFNKWDLKGAYFTFRLGPSISYLITEHLRFNLSAGIALVYAGTQYSVEQTYQPETADPVVSTDSSDEGKFLPGYFVDATLQYDITERAGFYAGAGYQDTGSYTQSAELNDTFTGSHASYKALVNLSGLSGFRMGMTFKF